MVKLRQKGFTLVEVSIVLAITALMILIAVTGSGLLRQQASQTGRLDELKNTLEKIRQEANGAIADKDNKSGYSVFGKIVEFDNSAGNDKQYKISTLVSDDSDDTKFLTKCDTRTVALNDQMHYLGPDGKGAIIFTRSPDRVYHAPGGYSDTGGDPSVCSAVAYAQPPSESGLYLPDGSGGGPLPSLPSCNDPGYSCGLLGQYYSSLTFAGAVTSQFTDLKIGDAMGTAASSYPDFIPTLKFRTKNPPNGVAVHWTGQIYLGDTSPHRICFKADDGSQAIVSAAAVSGGGALIGGQAVITNNLGSNDSPAAPCTLVKATAPGWFPIDIKYQQIDTGAGDANTQARLYEQIGSVDKDIPYTDGDTGVLLRTPTQPTIWPSTSYDQGLLGEYFSDINQGNKVSTYPGFNPIINSGVFPYRDYLAVLTATDGQNVSSRYTGQIYIPTAGLNSYCLTSDDGSKLTINGTVVVNNGFNTLHGSQMVCGNITVPAADWYSIRIDFQQGPVDAVLGLKRGSVTPPPTFTTVPESQLRHAVDSFKFGEDGNCTPAANTCVAMGIYKVFKSSSSGTTCANSNQAAQISFDYTGLTPGTQNIDIMYGNYPSGGLPVPPGYPGYKVCVYVNGNLLSSANPASLPIWEPSAAGSYIRTFTLNGVSVPASGNLNVKLDWINDSFVPGVGDANFEVMGVNMRKSMDAQGNIVAQKPAGTAPLTQSKQSKIASALARFLRIPAAYAAWDNNILNPENYVNNDSSSFYHGAQDYNFELQGVNGTQTITVDPSSNGITRQVH